MPEELCNATLAMWRAHELAPATAEVETSISGGENPSWYSNFCPEVAYETFRLFASTLIARTGDDIDRQTAERVIIEDPAPDGKDWRGEWSHIEPLHFSDCPLYAKLHQEKPVSNIIFNAPVTGNINVAGHSINAQAMSISLTELLAKIEASDVTVPDKDAAKSKMAEFLSHPVVAAIVGGLVGKIGS